MRLASVNSTAVGPARSIFENGRKTMKMMRSEGSSLKFSQIVADAVSPHLTSLGFRPKSLLDPQRHQVVSFARERGGRHEEIWIGRKLYDAGDPAVRDADERDDTEPVGGNPRVLASRRLFYASWSGSFPSWRRIRWRRAPPLRRRKSARGAISAPGRHGDPRSVRRSTRSTESDRRHSTPQTHPRDVRRSWRAIASHERIVGQAAPRGRLDHRR